MLAVVIVFEHGRFDERGIHALPDKAGGIESGRRRAKVLETRKARRQALVRNGRERWKVLEYEGEGCT